MTFPALASRAGPGWMAKGAAEISKGDLRMLVLSEADVMALLDLPALIDGLARGFEAMARDEIQTPARPEINIPGKGFSLAMPAWQEGMAIAVKVVNVFDGNLDVGMPNHLATISLFDPVTGAPLCVMDGTYITGVRTAASAVLSVRELARPDARVVTLIGAGVQGREHLKLLPLVRDFDEIRIASLHFEDAERLARLDPRARPVKDVAAAVRSSDVVCLASHSSDPVIDTDWLRPGTHVSSVGYAPPRGEIPFDLGRRARLFVETTEAFKDPPVGCAELVGIDPRTATTIGDMLNGNRPGRVSPEEITLYKAMGIAMEDLVAAHIVHTRALAENRGHQVTI